MKIISAEIRACREAAADVPLLTGSASEGLDFLVITLTTDDGVSGTSLGYAGRDLRVPAQVAAVVKDFFLGKDPFARERLWHEYRSFDRWWRHLPVYAYGAFDIACWDIAGNVAGLPLYRLLGEYRERVPVYGSSLVLDRPDDYAAQALEVQALGWHGYKLHPPGDVSFDLEAYRLAREAVGPDFALMADPVAAYSAADALRVGRALEKLDYTWLEEPLHDVDFRSLRKLADDLDIPVCGVEVLPGNNYSAAQCIADGVVDIVRTDVSWKGGVTAVMKTAAVAQSFGMQCELHSAIYHALEIVNLHCACALSNCTYLELLYPTKPFEIALRTGIEIDEDGFARPPEGPGIGIDLDWDYIDNNTVAVY